VPRTDSIRVQVDRSMNPTIAQSSSPTSCASVRPAPAQRRCTSSPALLGENGCCESFNSKLRDEFLNGETFYSLKEVQVLANGGASITTPRGRTLRWAIGHRRRQHGDRQVLLGHGKGESKERFPLSHTPDGCGGALISTSPAALH
jgi:hypothetical protein